MQLWTLRTVALNRVHNFLLTLVTICVLNVCNSTVMSILITRSTLVTSSAVPRLTASSALLLNVLLRTRLVWTSTVRLADNPVTSLSWIFWLVRCLRSLDERHGLLLQGPLSWVFELTLKRPFQRDLSLWNPGQLTFVALLVPTKVLFLQALFTHKAWSPLCLLCISLAFLWTNWPHEMMMISFPKFGFHQMYPSFNSSNRQTEAQHVLHNCVLNVAAPPSRPRVALFLSRTPRYVARQLPTLVPLNCFVILPARSMSRNWPNLATNSSVTFKIYCRGSTLNQQYNQELHYVGEVWTLKQKGVYVRHEAQRAQDGWHAMHGMLCYLVSFLTQRLSGRPVITRVVSMNSVYAVSRLVIRCVLRVLRSPEHTITTKALYVSYSASNVLRT